MEKDWRLQGQDKYLARKEFTLQSYRRYSANWDHDHCSFCWVKFSETGASNETEAEGYTCDDGYHWVCKQCFDDFKVEFEFVLAKNGA